MSKVTKKISVRTVKVQEKRNLSDLVSVGPATLRDFASLGIHTVDELRKQRAPELYARICERTGVRQDPCVQDVFRAAIEQAKNPNLEPKKRNWWYWSQVRKNEIRKKRSQ